MSKKALRMVVCVLMCAIFITVLFPAAAGGANSGQSVMYMPPTPADRDVNRYVPEPEYQEPLMTLLVETGDSEQVLVRVKKNAEKEEIKKAIEDMVESVLIKEEKGEDRSIKWESIIALEGVSDDEIEELAEEVPTCIALHDKIHPDFLDGYIFCNVSEPLFFDISDLFERYQVVSFEWDAEGDGIYEHSSISPTFFYRYDEPGLYSLRIRMTYAYTYEYWPIQPCWQGHICYCGISYYPSPSPHTLGFAQDDIEYQVLISVGSSEVGYPPIMRFTTETENGPINLIENNEESGLQTSTSKPYYGIDSYPVIIQPRNYLQVTRNLTMVPWIPNIESPSEEPQTLSLNYTTLMLSPNRPVSLSRIAKEVKVPVLSNHMITFNASATIHRQENPLFYWTFGDGDYGTREAMNHTYRRVGTYTTTLRISGWGYTHSETFKIMRGSEDPRRVMIGYPFPCNGEYRYEDYIYCEVNTPFLFDAWKMVEHLDSIRVEWDFDADGTYELKQKKPEITHTYEAPGYYEARIRYTYSCNYYGRGGEVKNSISTERCVKILVANEGGVFPPIPDFFISAPSTQSWWNSAGIASEVILSPSLRDVSFVRDYRTDTKFLNPFSGNMIFNASTTVNVDESTLSYFWDFGDGATGEGKVANYTYDSWPNNRKVTLNVYNGFYNTSIIKTIRRISSPNIYLYREIPCFDTIKVIVDGKVTKAIPEIPLSSEVMWEDVWVMGGKVFYQNKEYDYLYYEEEIEPVPSKYGWILARDRQGRYFLNDNPTSIPSLKIFFSNELSRAGLFYNEIEDFIEEWLGEDGRLIPKKGAFRYAIMYVPEIIVNNKIQIKTEKFYDEILRVHFLVQPAGKSLKLAQPVYTKNKKGTNILHEWGVYTKNSLITGNDIEDYNYSFIIEFPDQSHTPIQMSVARRVLTESTHSSSIMAPVSLQ